MSHEIDMTTGSAAIAFAGETPWHKLGTKFDGLMTSAEALAGANLDWTVIKQPAFYLDRDFQYAEIPGCYATVRSDTGAPLGHVGEQYKPIQNVDAFDFMDSVVKEGGIKYEVAGALHGGRLVWLLAKLPSQTVVSHDDITNHYLLFTNSHDGRYAASVGYTTVRVVCQNTLRIAKPKYKFKIRHSGSIQSKLVDAQCALGLAHEAFNEFGQQAKALSFKNTTKKMVNQFKLAFFGVTAEDDMTKKHKQDWERITELAETGRGTDLPGVRGTYWGLVNAVTEFVDHERPRREKTGYETDSLKMSMNTWGNGHEYKDRAWQLACSLV